MRGASSDGSAEAVPRGAGVAVLQGMSGLLLQPRPARDRRGWAAEKAVRPGGQAVRARRKGRRPSYALGHTHPVALRGRRARPDVPSARTRLLGEHKNEETWSLRNLAACRRKSWHVRTRQIVRRFRANALHGARSGFGSFSLNHALDAQVQTRRLLHGILPGRGCRVLWSSA